MRQRLGKRNAVCLILKKPFENYRPASLSSCKTIPQAFLEVHLRFFQEKYHNRQYTDLNYQVPPKEYDPTSRSRNLGSPEQGFPGSRPSQASLLRNRQYTNLDLIKADTPFTPKKISKMLHQLEFKHQVELQYKEGIDKMAKLYQADGDKKSKADAEAKRFESDKKIQLLESALKRYKKLYILDDVEDDEDGVFAAFIFNDTQGLVDASGNDSERKDKLRSKPLSGTLYVTVQGARELDHAPIVSRSRSSSKGVDTFVSIKAEGTQLAKSHPSRTDKWNEDFEIVVDKANEIEIVVYDKQVNDPNPVPIGLLWIRITDLVDSLRRQKVGMDAQGGWVTAGAMPGEASSPMSQQSGSGDLNVPVGYNPSGAPGSGFQGQASDGIDAWFAVEPAGALALRLNFGEDMIRSFTYLMLF